jgi:2-oxo-hept-3-ene-1,7-dioate hydratase
MTPKDHAKAAADLLDAEASLEQIGLLTKRHPEMGMDDAYAVQNAIYRAKLAQGRSVVGWKIGLTSKAMQYALNIDIPDSGILFDDMVFKNGEMVPKGRFIQPRVEAEIAFMMKSPIGGADVTRNDVLAATDYVAPSIEILDTRIGW